jgi:hypothetical protein
MIWEKVKKERTGSIEPNKTPTLYVRNTRLPTPLSPSWPRSFTPCEKHQTLTAKRDGGRFANGRSYVMGAPRRDQPNTSPSVFSDLDTKNSLRQESKLVPVILLLHLLEWTASYTSRYSRQPNYTGCYAPDNKIARETCGMVTCRQHVMVSMPIAPLHIVGILLEDQK